MRVETYAFLKLHRNVSRIRSFSIRIQLLGPLEPDVVIGVGLFFNVEIIEVKHF